MTPRGHVGGDSPIDQLLATYGLERGGMVHELLEDETNVLLAALLLEQRGNSVYTEGQPPDQARTTYTSREDVDVTADLDTISWDFPATTVSITDFDEPIRVAFDNPAQGDRWITLEVPDEPATFSPGSGLGTAKLWFDLADAAAGATSIDVLAFK